MFEYDEAIEQYAMELEVFIAKYELPANWFKAPDHIAIKCADALDYVYTLEDLLPDASQGSQIEMDKRRLAGLKLTSAIKVGSLGSVEWVEVMEPRPNMVGKDVVGLEHMEFYYPKFDEVTKLLDKYNIEYKLQKNPGHSWVNIVINNQGQELKLNDKLLGETIAEELEQGIAKLLIEP